MNELTKKLLLAMGLTQTQIDNLESATPTLDVDATVKAIRENNIKLLKNDADFLKEIRDAEKGKNLDEFERYIKKTFGLSSEEIKDKKFDEIIKIAKDKATAGNDKTLNDLQAENVKLTADIAALKDVEIPKIRGEVDAHKKQFNVNTALTKKLAELKLRNPISVVLKHLETEFGDKYTIDIDDKGDLKIFNKDTKLEVKNADGTKLLTADEIIKSSLSENKFLEESGADDAGSKHGKPDPKNDGKKDGDDKDKTKVFAPNLNKAEAYLAEMKEKEGKK